MSAARVDPCGCDEALDLRRQVDALVVERDAMKAKASEMKAAMLGLHKMLTRWSNCPCKACSECIEEVCPAWDDARAGMVPEGECTHVGKRTELWDRLHEKLNAATVEHEAELAKAWEAGRDAAAQLGCFSSDTPCSGCGFHDKIRALQPPGGKAK